MDLPSPRSQQSSTLISSNILFLWLSAVSLLILCSSASPSPIPPRCSREEASSLLRLFHGSSFNITADLPSWTPGTDCCTWEGIICEQGTSSVVELDLFMGGISADVNADAFPGLPHLSSIDLSWNNLRFSSTNGSSGWCQALSSTLPKLQVLRLQECSLSGDISCLSQFHFLSEITLNGNHFSSELPSFTSNFSSLTSLRLYDCGLRGRLPESLFRLPKLETLDLSYNPLLTGYLPEFSRHSALQVLGLSSTGISGELPNSIGYLKFLRILDLKKCNLMGQIPESIGNLSNLTSLILDSNNFSGPIPALHRENLSNILKLDLQNNSLSGPIPSSLFLLASLKYLLLNSNRLSGQLREFPNASSSPLKRINLRDNKLQGEIPGSIFMLPMLETLTLSFNKFTGILEADTFLNTTVSDLDLSYNPISVLPYKPSHANCSNGIQSLNLAACDLSNFPEFLTGGCENISMLDLSNNRIGGEVPTWIWKMGTGSKLGFLNLSFNLLEGFEQPLPDNLHINISFSLLDLHSNLLQGPLVIPSSVNVLDYSNNRFTSVLAEHIEPLLSSRVISLSDNNLNGEIPPSICNRINLDVLDLSNNNLSGSIPSCMLNTSGLTVLNLRGNRLSGVLPQSFGDPCYLSSLDVSENQLEGKLPRSLAKCRDLVVLNLRQNKLMDTFPSWLGDLPLLRVIILQSNGFHGHVTCEKTSNNTFQGIQILDLSSNNFNGELPSNCFKHFKEMMMHTKRKKIDIIGSGTKGYYYYQDSVKITLKGELVEYKKILHTFNTLDFSSNHFEGRIPSSLGKLKSLILLNISGNSLEGMIPLVLGDLVSLESLDLSRNTLSGNIPDQLLHLTFLEILNLSYNQLSGAIPQGAQFSTFSNNSFVGNVGLCGPPLSRRCTGVDEGRPPTAPLTPATSGIDWGSDKIAFGLGAGIGVSWCPIILWWKGFFDAHQGPRRRRR